MVHKLLALWHRPIRPMAGAPRHTALSMTHSWDAQYVQGCLVCPTGLCHVHSVHGMLGGALNTLMGHLPPHPHPLLLARLLLAHPRGRGAAVWAGSSQPHRGAVSPSVTRPGRQKALAWQRSVKAQPGTGTAGHQVTTRAAGHSNLTLMWAGTMGKGPYLPRRRPHASPAP